MAAECLKHPSRRSVWSPQLGRYVCREDSAERAIATDPESVHHPPLNPQFKLVFATAAGGTFFFISLCVLLTLLSGKNPELMEEVVRGLFSLAQIGFGAVVGLLGGQRLQDNGKR